MNFKNVLYIAPSNPSKDTSHVSASHVPQVLPFPLLGLAAWCLRGPDPKSFPCTVSRKKG